MARAGKKLVAYLRNEDGDVVRVSKGGRNYWITYADKDHICHPSVGSVQGAKREALLVFHVDVPIYEPVD
jgi:hypothetical protein